MGNMKVTTKIENIDEVEMRLVKEGKLKPVDSFYGYVNNKELYAEFCEYYKRKQEALAQGLTHPPLTEKIGAAIIQIATRRCNSRQFVGYTNSWKEELISHAIMTGAIRGHNFNPEKSNNPFAYLTQVCNNAIVEQLKKEKKQLYVKYKSMEEVNGFNAHSDDNVNETDFESYEEGNEAHELRRKYIGGYEASQFPPKVKDTKEVDEGIMKFA